MIYVWGNNNNNNKNLELIFKVASLQSHTQKKKKKSHFLECFCKENFFFSIVLNELRVKSLTKAFSYN